MPPLLVGFTIVAIGTSLPELAVALEAVRTDADEIAVGGVLGSNVANVMLVLYGGDAWSSIGYRKGS